MSEALLAGARAGTVVELGNSEPGDAGPDHPELGAAEAPNTPIGADFLLDVLTGRTAVQVHPRGLRLRGARITGEMTWDWQRLPVALELVDCVIDNPITLDHAQVAGLSLIGCRLPGLSAEQMTCASTLKLVRSTISGTVKLRDAVVNGAVLAAGASIHGEIDEVDRVGVRIAVQASRLRVTGAVLLGDGFSAEGAVLLSGARIGGSLNCASGQFRNLTGDALEARDAEFGARVELGDGFAAEGRVLFDRSKVNGDLVCDGGRFDGRGGKAFSGNRMEIGGGLFQRAEFIGPVRLFGVQIAGSWTCQGGTFVNPSGEETIWASGANVLGSVYFNNGFSSRGSIRMRGAQIGGNFGCGGATFENPGGVALRGVNLTVGGDVLFGATAQAGALVADGEVSFVGARIGGVVLGQGATLANPGGIALNFGEAEIVGNLHLDRGFQAVGEVRLGGARIGGNVDCIGATFRNPASDTRPISVALNLVGVDVGANIMLREGFLAEGQVRMNRARIGGMLECGGGTFRNPGRFSLFARAIRVGAGVRFTDGFVAEGSVRLSLAQITGDLDCIGGTFTEDFQAGGSAVTGSFRWRQLPVPPGGVVDLRRTTVGELDDDLAGWPGQGRLRLAGFSYGRLSDRAPRSPSDRVEWVRRQRGYHPEPYQQLAAVYRSNGQISEATTVEIAQQDDLLARGDLTRPAKAWTWFLGRSLGHGYRPGRAAWALLGLYAVTVVTVWLGARSGAFIQVGDTAPQPTVTATRCGDAYPCLSVPAYALENITPILNLHQAENWHPKSSTPAEWMLRDWLYLSTVLGYAGTTLLAAGLSGLARTPNSQLP